MRLPRFAVEKKSSALRDRIYEKGYYGTSVNPIIAPKIIPDQGLEVIAHPMPLEEHFPTYPSAKPIAAPMSAPIIFFQFILSILSIIDVVRLLLAIIISKENCENKNFTCPSTVSEGGTRVGAKKRGSKIHLSAFFRFFYLPYPCPSPAYGGRELIILKGFI
jgi:hypothetical protein